MFTILDDGFVRVTGRDGLYRIPDMQARAAKRATLPAEVHPFAGVGNDLGCPLVSARLTETLARQSVYGQERLAKTFQGILHGFASVRLDADMGIALNIARQFKAKPAREVLAEKIPSLFGRLRGPLDEAVTTHIDRLASARRHLADAKAPEIPSDPAAALAQSIRQMEIRSRAAQMSEPERVRLIADLGQRGQIAPLAAMVDDPLHRAVAPGRVLDDAMRAAFKANGGEFFYAEVEDAEHDLETIGVVAELIHGGVVAELTTAGVPADMLRVTGDYQSRANTAIAQ